MKVKTFARGLFALDCGSIFINKDVALASNPRTGESVEVPMFAFLIKLEEGNLLFDAGIDQDDRAFFAPWGKAIVLNKENLLLNRLKDLGVSPDEINYVFLSHLHFDHAGLVRYFKKAKVFVQRQEYAFAINPPPFAVPLYRRHYYDSPSLNWQVLDGDQYLMPGIAAVFTPGHTPGHQSLLVDFGEKGTKILTGDCVYVSASIEQEVTSGIFVDQLQSLHSLKKLKTLSQITGGELVFSHASELRETIRNRGDCRIS